MTCDKAKTYLGFAPKFSVAHMVDSLFRHLDDYGDLSNDAFYNIRTFGKLKQSS